MRIEIAPRDLRARAAALRRASADLVQTVAELEDALALMGQASPVLRSLGGVIDGMASRAQDLEDRASFTEAYQPIEDLAEAPACTVDDAGESGLAKSIYEGLVNYGAGRANGMAMFASEAINMTTVPYALQWLGLMDPVDIDVPAAFPDAAHADVIHGIGTAEGYLGLTALEIGLSPQSGVTGIGAAVLQTVTAIDELARRLLPIDGYHDVVIFGSPHPLIVGQVEGELALDHRTVASLVSHSPAYDGGPVRLVSASSTRGISQDLANKLGVEVLAADGIPWMQPNGGATVEPTSVHFAAFTPGAG